MKIHELAQKTGLTASTIRFYEQAGLLDEQHVRREANNYRFYYEEAVERLIRLKRNQAAGFTLAELKILFQARAVQDNKTKYELLCCKIAEIEKRQDELQIILDELHQIQERFIANRVREREETGR